CARDRGRAWSYKNNRFDVW
nr:immunoglobulin heavy chain junction region [Macaca mulatta]MOW99123.1 immunoglobulin heavy chain junction region [Macaca mulatta]MOW99268.1 immunoglobulin heavy chain junction region [Macaca mulatta]MOW99293.1 immunoglobulin heavy chain junction region [Macaca mulatta]MOW99998.1 immunoglobulin heavy chain junction region [Macaca mulatta]